MAFQKIRHGNFPNNAYEEYVCDTEADMANISPAPVPPGSVCIVLEPFKVFMMNTQNKWVEV